MEQARAAAARLAVLPIAVVYASPIERTTQTASYIAAPLGLDAASSSDAARGNIAAYEATRMATFSNGAVDTLLAAFDNMTRKPGEE